MRAGGCSGAEVPLGGSGDSSEAHKADIQGGNSPASFLLSYSTMECLILFFTPDRSKII